MLTPMCPHCGQAHLNVGSFGAIDREVDYEAEIMTEGIQADCPECHVEVLYDVTYRLVPTEHRIYWIDGDDADIKIKMEEE